MPRIREVKLDRFNTTQDIASDATIAITSRPSDDLLRAVGADYAEGCSYIPATSDIGTAWENGFGFTSAGLLSGATECAHVDAVCWAHAFNSRDFYDPRHDVYHSPDWSAWEEFHRAHGTECPSCGAINYGDDSYSPDSCDNCLASLADGAPAGYEAEEIAQAVFGYVTAATWTDLQRTCEDCEGTGVDPETADELEADQRGCATCEGSGGAQESGSDPYEYGPDALSTELHAEIRSDVVDFLRSNYADCHAYVNARGTMIDHPQAAGGSQLGERECSGWEQLGHDLYLTAAGHGAGFWDRFSAPMVPRIYPRMDREDLSASERFAGSYVPALPAMMVWANARKRALYELGERLTAASKPHTVPTIYLIDGEISS